MKSIEKDLFVPPVLVLAWASCLRAWGPVSSTVYRGGGTLAVDSLVSVVYVTWLNMTQWREAVI
jgi:hypothetical protein